MCFIFNLYLLKLVGDVYMYTHTGKTKAGLKKNVGNLSETKKKQKKEFKKWVSKIIYRPNSELHKVFSPKMDEIYSFEGYDSFTNIELIPWHELSHKNI